MKTKKKNLLDYSDRFLKTLKEGVRPALGCTEPVAVGLATARAYKEIEGEIVKLKAKVSPNVFKNGKDVGIPGTKEIGLVFAAALGVTCGDSDLGLEVFRPVNRKAIVEAEKLLEANKVDVELETKKGNFYIEANIKTSSGRASCIIKDSHTNIVYVEANGKVLLEKDNSRNLDSNGSKYLKDITIENIREFVETVEYSKIEFLLEGVKLNMDMAQVGLKEKSGAGIGAGLDLLSSNGHMKRDVISEARILASAACDARMAGVNMPVMSSGGSGNQGITAIIPPAVVCKHLGYSDDKLARTLAFSHLMVAYTKVYLGGLSPVCGCAVSAGIGATSSIVWALGGTNKQIAGAIKNIVGSLTGMVCDGAKGGCGFKISTATAEAIIQAQLAMENIIINQNDGIVDEKVEDTIKNLARFSNRGMANADREIINIMLKR